MFDLGVSYSVRGTQKETYEILSVKSIMVRGMYKNNAEAHLSTKTNKKYNVLFWNSYEVRECDYFTNYIDTVGVLAVDFTMVMATRASPVICSIFIPLTSSHITAAKQ